MAAAGKTQLAVDSRTRPSCCACSASHRQTSGAQCETQEVELAGDDSEDDNDAPAATPRLVRLESVAKCRGVTLAWSLLSTIVVRLGTNMDFKPEAPLLYVLPITSEWAESNILYVDPPVP